MNRMVWGWTIALGLLLARIGYTELEAADAVLPEWSILMLVTGGLTAGLLGVTGLLGLLGWVPQPGARLGDQ
ncbi:hypothetical protein ACFFTM_16620 [Pseudoduganella plicata]|uniref:DUF2970 domain-containing protein n=1 Tax=Pseudoduganella plicata TaxID=321984 RepID=A0A4P7BJA1_9BURK|nr:hypothetical protein [Pseudoduganella plicata]QBQ38984.1 hypothetical protein E1742_24660 [Pseudoduganella plicata]GGY86256.1 hypothetical protein GCM10007388_19310 [Pseudoduganella plicata]